MLVRIDGKSYVADVKWFNFDNIQQAKEKLKELDGVKGIIKQQGLYLVYEADSRGILLATGFLHLASGYYYIKTDEEQYWVLLKGVDGGILLDTVVDKLEEAENKHYNLFLGFYGPDGVLNRIELDIKEGKGFVKTASNLSLPKVFLLGISVLVILILSVILLLPQKKPPPPPPQPVSTPTLEEPLSQPQQLPPLQLGYLSLDCYDKFFSSFSDCSFQLSSKNMTAQDIDYTCEDALNNIYNIARKTNSSLTWGDHRQEPEGIYLYSFSISGQIPRKKLAIISKYLFENANLEIKGDIQNYTYTVSLRGVLGCK